MTKDIFHRNKKGRKIAVLANPPPGFGREGKWGPKKLVYKGKERPQTKAARAGTSLQAQKDEEEYDASSFVDATDFLNLQEDSEAPMNTFTGKHDRLTYEFKRHRGDPLTEVEVEEKEAMGGDSVSLEGGGGDGGADGAGGGMVA